MNLACASYPGASVVTAIAFLSGDWAVWSYMADWWMRHTHSEKEKKIEKFDWD